MTAPREERTPIPASGTLCPKPHFGNWKKGTEGWACGSAERECTWPCTKPWQSILSKAQWGLVTHSWNLSTGEVEAGRPEVQGHPWLYEFEASLDGMRSVNTQTCLRTDQSHRIVTPPLGAPQRTPSKHTVLPPTQSSGYSNGTPFLST